MRKIVYAIIALFFLTPVFAFAQTAESITAYNVVFDVNTDGSFTAHEKITYDFGDNEKHGIYRDIPVIYQSDSGVNAHVYISNVHVTDESGSSYAFDMYQNGNDERIKIGDANFLVSGVHIYNIDYTVKDGLGYFDTHDEIYWNAVGTKWQVPISNISATVNLPQGVASNELQAACYYGAQGSQTSCNASHTEASKTVTFTSPSLAPYQGMTVVVGFPKGMVIQPSASEHFVNRFLSFNWIAILLPCLAFVLCFIAWWKRGRDPKGTGIIIPQYEAVDGVSPMEAAFLMNGRFDDSLSAEIIFLAQKGYIHIARTEHKHLMFTNTDYILRGLKAPGNDLKPFQKEILDGLFTVFPSEVSISSLKNSFYRKLKNIESSAKDGLGLAGYYPPHGMYQNTTMSVLGSISFVVAFYSFPSGLEWALSFGASAIVFFFFSRIMRVMSPKGVAARENLLGLKLYVSVAEKNRIDFHNAPEKKPETFEKFLPYAMVFGVEKAWAEEFKDIYTTPPSWYGDPYMHGFNTGLFVSQLSSFNTTAHAAMASAPGSRSGLGGGGFSGGGGGGGGGGSW